MSGQTEEKKHICVGLMAHVDAGKTTLSEAMLYLSGAIRKLGRVDARNAFLDTNELERARGITIFSKQALFLVGETKVTLLDTPGHVDFGTEMERTLQILDMAVLVISGADGVQGHTRTLWQLLKRYQIPTYIFVNKMDQNGTSQEEILAELKKSLDAGCIPFFPMPEQSKYYEEIAACEEHAMEEYFQTGSVSRQRIQQLIQTRKIFPCYFGSALKLQGVNELMAGMDTYGVIPQYAREFGARVYKITRDDQGNRLTHMKITGGSLKVKALLENGEKVNQIRIYSGMQYETCAEAMAGTVCAVTGLNTTQAGAGLGREKQALRPRLQPVLTYQLILPEDMDAHRAIEKLRPLEEEDPQLHIVWNEQLQEIQVNLMGAVQIEILKSVILERFGMNVEFGMGNIVYKETIREAVEGVGHFEPLRHYAEVHLLMEPGEPGSGLQFETDCSEDILARNWQRLIMTHLQEREHSGVLIGAPITDMKITLVNGRAHNKHTEGGDFRQATYRAIRQGLQEAGGVLLEPYYDMVMEVPQDMVGRALADMDQRHAEFELSQTGTDMAIITGSAPVETMRDYQLEFHAYTKGKGKLSFSLKGYYPCHNQEKVIAASGYDAESDMANPTGSVFCSHGAGIIIPWNEVKEHMHLECRLTRNAEQSQGEQEIPLLKKNTANTKALPYGAADKELEEIFRKTYKTKDIQENREQRPTVKSLVEPRKPYKPQKPKEEYLLVDGYNIVFAWEELKELAAVTIDGARSRLLDILCNYQGFKKCTLIVVFDAYRVKGNIGAMQDYHNIHVVYTKEAETADAYIAKLAQKIAGQYRVTVATSDNLVQLIVWGAGCQRMSAGELRQEIEAVNLQMKQDYLEQQDKSKNYLGKELFGEISLTEEKDEEM